MSPPTPAQISRINLMAHKINFHIDPTIRLVELANMLLTEYKILDLKLNSDTLAVIGECKRLVKIYTTLYTIYTT